VSVSPSGFHGTLLLSLYAAKDNSDDEIILFTGFQIYSHGIAGLLINGKPFCMCKMILRSEDFNMRIELVRKITYPQC